MKRTTFLIDGFNLYHSLVDATRALDGAQTKWLSIRSLCSSYLPLIAKDAVLADVVYFSALAVHLEAADPEKVNRHKTYIACLENSGVRTELSRFKKKFIRCDVCRAKLQRHEEKETDVAIAVSLLELFTSDSCDCAVLVTGDTDLAPAVRTAQRMFPSRQIIFAFPYARKNRELARLAKGSFTIGKEQYAKHQFPDVVTVSENEKIHKPSEW